MHESARGQATPLVTRLDQDHAAVAVAVARRGHDRLAAGDVGGAQALFAEALELDADCVCAHYEMGMVASSRKACEVALIAYRRALAIGGQDPVGLLANIGITLWRLQRFTEAREVLDQAFSMTATPSPMLHHNLGMLYYATGEPERAVEHYRASLVLQARHGTQFGREDLALALLKSGDLRAGMEAYECRWDVVTKSAVWDCGLPHWEGEDLSGKTIVVHHEQGYGDTLQFVRYCSILSERGATVVLAVPESLVRVLSGCCGVSDVVDMDDLGVMVRVARAADYHCPMLSVLRVLGSTYGDVPRYADGYLRTPPITSEKFRTPGCRLAVGVVWAASTHDHSRLRSVDVVEVAALAEVPGVRLYGLQVGSFREDLTRTGADVVVIDAVGGVRDFADTAAVVSGLDLVVSVDTGLMHLAAALGKPVWMFQPVVPCWRWCRGTELWYPRLRAWQQVEAGTWRGVVAAMVAELRAVVRGASALCGGSGG